MENYVLEEMLIPVYLAILQGLGAGGVVVGTMNMIDRLWIRSHHQQPQPTKTDSID